MTRMEPVGNRTDSPGQAALVETILKLFPEGRVSFVDGGGDDVYYAIPNLRSPRLLVPADPVAGYQSLLRFSAALPIGDTLGRVALAYSRRIRLPVLRGDRIAVSDATGSLREYLSDLFDEGVSVSLGIGNARANRKPVLGVFSSQGRPLAYVKVGTDAFTAGLVRNETAALQQLEIKRVGFEHPRVRHAGDWNGMPILVMSALHTVPWQGLRSRRQPTGVLGELAGAFAQGTKPFEESGLWKRLAAVGESLEASLRESWKEALDRVTTRHGRSEVDVAAWHGDLTPWNLARRGATAQIWDWERFETGVPVGLDAIHYALQRHAEGRTPTASDLRRSVAESAVDPSIGEIYLLTLAARYLEADSSDSEVTARVREKGRRVLEVLEELQT